VSREALDRGLATVNGHYASAVSRGRFSQDVMDRRMALIRPTLSCSDLKDADIVVEAVFEDMPVKRQVLDTLDGTCRLGAILATSTSTLDINEIAAVTSRPEAVIGLHFFSPVDAMRLLEIVRGARSSKSVIATCMKLSRTLKKVGVLVGACNGFVGNRMLDEYLREAGFLLEEGAMPQQVDRALQEYGFDMGPFSRICEMGRLGRKTGAGYYRYEAGRLSPLTDPVVEDLIVDASKELGMKRREISDKEIVERMVYALVNEGAKILEEAIALRSSDIDLVSVLGYGFPSYRGGPMFYAETIGYDKVCKRVKEFHESHGERWKPAPLLQRLSEGGARERKSPLPHLPR
jgi:3-hydroxyacyl-CoA dehydrogenase